MSTLQISKIQDVFLAVSETAIAERDEAVAEAELITRVDSPATRDMAGLTLRRLKGIANETETSRKDVGKPVLELTRKINSLADEFITPAKREIDRLNRLIAEDAMAQERIRRAKEAEMRAEQMRLEKERQDAIAAARVATTEPERQAAFEHAATVKEVQRALPVAIPEPPKPKGVAVRIKFSFEIIDAAKAYASHPHFFDLTPRARVIDSTINLPNANRDIPGIRIFEEAKLGVRA